MSDSTRKTVEALFASSGATVDMSVAEQEAGWTAVKPPHQNFNWFWLKLTSMLQNAEQNGVMEWSSLTEYAIYGTARGSDGRTYRSNVAANLNNDPVTDVSGNWSYDNPFQGLTSYESAQQAVPSASSYVSVSHGLGTTPIISDCVLVCTTAQYGYSVGDEIILTNSGGDSGRAQTAWRNSTELGFGYAESIRIAYKDSNDKGNITTSNWRIVFRAWA